MTFNHTLARMSVGGYDAAQDIRTATMNRVRDVVRKKNEGIPFDQTEDEKEDRDYDSKYDDDKLPDLMDQMVSEGKLDDEEFEYLWSMLEAAQTAADMEDQFESIMGIVKSEPIYDEWLTHVYGISVVTTSRLLYQFGYCEDFDKVSNLWSYSGYAPGQDRTRGETLDYNPDCRTLGWNIAKQMVKGGSQSNYRVEFYDPYKDEQVKRMENSMCQFCGEPTSAHEGKNCDEMPDRFDRDLRLSDFEIGHQHPDGATPPWSQGHADMRALRYLAKKFYKHYWAIARDLKNHPTPDEYIIAHGGHDKQTDTFENPFYAKRQVIKP